MQTEPEQWAEALWDHLLNKTFSRRQAIEAIQRTFEERERKLAQTPWRTYDKSHAD